MQAIKTKSEAYCTGIKNVRHASSHQTQTPKKNHHRVGCGDNRIKYDASCVTDDAVRSFFSLQGAPRATAEYKPKKPSVLLV
jgi:hypothetical protein